VGLTKLCRTKYQFADCIFVLFWYSSNAYGLTLGKYEYLYLQLVLIYLISLFKNEISPILPPSTSRFSSLYNFHLKLFGTIILRECLTFEFCGLMRENST
jgi:hypothetical protein